MKIFRQAKSEDLNNVILFYDRVIEVNNKAEINLRWSKNGHPSHELINNSIENGELFVIEDDDEILSALIANKSHNKDYDKVKWEINSEEDFRTIHVLATNPDHFREGLSEMILKGLIDYAKKAGLKALKLDVFKINGPAIRLYEKLGFINRGEVTMFVPRVGDEVFYLFEKVI